MTLFNKLVFALLAIIVVPLAAFAADKAVGVLKGQVNYCDNGGVDGMLVYVPGRQYTVVTGEDGAFLFDRLMPGEYQLKFKTGGNVLSLGQSVYVFSQRVNDLGEVTLCAGANSALASPAMPSSPVKGDEAGSETVAPAVKSAGNGRCSGGNLVAIPGGTADCKDGELKVFSCKKGAADCDGRIDNGCETDLMEDDENCGACGNACSDLDSCSLGVC